jgi:hypothetical protein
MAACSSHGEPQPGAKPAPHAKLDGGVPGITTIQGYDPASGMHLDEGGERRTTAPAMPARAARPIDVTLRSTPPGAMVSVDGAVVGNTPTYWPGEADGREHTFVFALTGYAVAQYRFVPVTSGVIHVRLDRIAEDPASGSSDAPEGAPVPGAGATLVNPPPAPAVPAPPPPPTVVTPDAAEAPPVGPGPQP